MALTAAELAVAVRAWMSANGLDAADPPAFEPVGTHAWVAEKRCCGQNCWLHLSQRMGAKSTFPHFARAHTGVDFFWDLPVMTEHSELMWASMRMLGSCPGGTATGVLHRGHDGAMRLYLLASYLLQLCSSGT